MVLSWDVANDLPAFDLRPLVTAERRALLDFLRLLPEDHWTQETACVGWSVHDVVLHLLGNDFGRMIAPSPESTSGSADFGDLAARIEQSNDAWVEQARAGSRRGSRLIC
jgi:uncharacterized damage-inducible protein DinB